AVFGRRGMGEGDSKLLMMIGAFLGWQGAAFALFAGAAQGLTVAAYGLLTGKKLAPEPPDEEEDGADELDEQGELAQHQADPPPRWLGHLKLPFGPFLALGALEYLFFGDTLVGAWLRVMETGMGLVGGG